MSASSQTADLRGGDTGGVVPVEALTDPHRLARLFRDERCRHADGTPTLIYWQGAWLKWAGAYRTVAGSELRAELTRTVKAEFDRINREELRAWIAAGKVDKMGNPCPPPVARKVSRNLVGDVDQTLGGCIIPGGKQTPSLSGETSFS